MKNNFIGQNLDFIGFSASFLCAIHCALVPLLLTVTALSGIHFLGDPIIELSLIVVSIFIAGFSMAHGYIKHHGKKRAIVTVVGGFLLILFGHLLESEILEAILVPIGGITIAMGHVINWRLCKNS